MAGRMLSGCIQLRRVNWMMINSSVKKFSTLTPSSKEILKDLPEHIVPLKLGFCQVYLVGVRHDTQESAADVQRIVRAVKPDVVFLELSENSQGILFVKEIPTTKEVVEIAKLNWKDRKFYELFRDFKDMLKVRQLKVIPVSELRIAYEEAIKYGGSVILGDRPVEVTEKRVWRKMPLTEMIKFHFAPFPKRSKGSEKLGPDDVKEFFKRFPTWAEAYVHERDIFMAKGILSEAKKSKSVVAVVGRAHLEGIKKHLQHKKQLNDLSVNDLLTIPPPNHNAKIVTSLKLLPYGVAMAMLGIPIWTLLSMKM